MVDFGATVTREEAECLAGLVHSVARQKMVAVDVGTWKGLTASIMAEAVRPLGGRVYCVERDRGIIPVFRANIAELGLSECVCTMVMESVEAAAIFGKGEADLVWIDADHSREATRRDIEAWLPKVRPGGILCGHDYNCHAGVNQAVEEAFGSDFENPKTRNQDPRNRIWVKRIPSSA